ncbi:MAG: hypothetical protein KKG00_00565, partial [Bacteroidetes bacterium]|nr:hypothetical protein [Bacteroidota bacterium]
MRTVSNTILVCLFGLLSVQFSIAQTSGSGVDEVIMEKVRETELKHRISESGVITFTFSVEEDRTQAVLLFGKVNTSFSTDYMTIISRVLLVDKSRFDNRVAFDLLKKNWNYTNWSWQIKEEESTGKVYVYLGTSVPVR